jgi:hypothetical protein
MKIKFNKSYYDKIKKLKELPDLYEGFLDGISKRNAIQFIKIFQDGLEKDTLGLEPLKESTVKQKRRQGLSKPETPLYGKGKTDKNSLINVFKIVKGQKKYDVVPRRDKHHKAKMEIDTLLRIHTSGATITRGDKTWRLPARPAALIALKIFTGQKVDKKSIAKEIKQAVSEFFKKGFSKIFGKYDEYKNDRSYD